MKSILERKRSGLHAPMKEFIGTLVNAPAKDRIDCLRDAIMNEMRSFNFDDVTCDAAGTIIGTVNGFKNEGDVVLLAPLDLAIRDNASEMDEDATGYYRSGIIASIYTAALLKRSLLPLTGNLLVCIVPRAVVCDVATKYLFEYTLAKRKIIGVIISEPTDCNIYLGSRGRMEYEIAVKGKMNSEFFERNGVHALGTLFPLINELEHVSRNLPRDTDLGNASLSIKDIVYSEGASRTDKEFKVIVDRTFTPQEDNSLILDRAKTIAEHVYTGEKHLSIAASTATATIISAAGESIVLTKDVTPWKMDSNHPFVRSSLDALTENGIAASIGYWRRLITEGSYTAGERRIPTIGFGVGREDKRHSYDDYLDRDALDRAILGESLIVYRNIGMPTFGWCDDEI